MKFSRMSILYKKELKDSFLSPMVYILAGMFSLIIGWLFFNYVIFANNLHSATVIPSILSPIFGNMNFIFLLMAPLLSMNCLAGEFDRGTMDLLTMSNLTLFEIIGAKFLSLCTVAFFMISFSFIFPLVLAVAGYSDWGMVLSGYVGLLLCVASYLSVGVFASSLTKNQIIAAMVSLGILLLLMLLSLSVAASGNIYLTNLFKYLSLPVHFERFVRGSVASYSVIYYVTFISFFLTATHQVLKARKW